MYSSATIAPLALALGLLAIGAKAQGCESHGVDFQNGGSYFQNISSADPFTFVSIYQNCEDDYATNILVDPNSDEYLCSDTPLRPDDVEELSTCPLLKNQMFSGMWSVLILSDNGDGAPIAYMRDFDLAVGTPVTTTFTPTISVTVTSTPLSTTTSTTTTTTTYTVTSSTVLPAKTKAPTKTITPAPTTTTKVFGPTIKLTATEFSPILTTKTITKTCTVSTQVTRDPTLTYRPTSLPTTLSNLADELDLLLPPTRRDSNSNNNNNNPARRVPVDPSQRIAERRARVAALEKRAPDSSTTTLTNTDPSSWPTSTSTSFAPTSTLTITSVSTSTSTTTTVSTIYSGTTTLPTSYITLPTRTVTKLKPTIFTSTVATVTKYPVVTVTVAKDDPVATRACKGRGGEMVEPKEEGKKCLSLLGLLILC